MRWDISSNFKSQKTAHRAAKRPPAGNKKLSKVTSGYGGLMIPLGRIRATPKNGDYMGVPQKNEYFQAKNGPRRPPRRPLCNRFNTKTLPFWCPVMKVTKKLDGITKKWIWGRKNCIFGSKKDHFRQSVLENGPPSSRTDTYRKTEGIQSYLRTWGSYDPIRSGPSEAKQGG